MNAPISNYTDKKYLDKLVNFSGRVKKIRNLGNVAFIVLNDRSASVQCVMEKNIFEEIKSIHLESILSVEGTLVLAPNKKDYEVQVKKVEILVNVANPTPIELSKPKIDAHLDTILDNRSIALRHASLQAIFKIQSTLLYSFAKTMRSNDFTEFRSPVLLGVPSESGASVFEVEFYDHKAYLAQSPQIFKQIMVGVFDRVFCVSPVFRAEKHNTSRHLIEMTQLDGEMGYITSYEDILEMIEKVVLGFISDISLINSHEINLLKVQLPSLDKTNKIPRLKVKEVLKIVEKLTKKSADRDELDLEPEDEQIVGDYVKKEYGSDFLFVLNYKKDKNFYTWNDGKFPDESLSYDLLFRGLEILSGTHRIHDKVVLIERMKSIGLTLENYKPYLEAFEYGLPSHGGFSFGLERLTKQFCNLANIREATLFPTDQERIASQKISTIKYD